jgi:predicted nucleic acid-binding protein
MVYADSSFLARLYLPDAKTNAANTFLAKEQTPLAFTPFNRVELRNLLRNMVARGEATLAAVAKAFALIESDLNEASSSRKRSTWVSFLKSRSNSVRVTGKNMSSVA